MFSLTPFLVAGSTADEESKIDPVAPIYLNAKYGVDMRERTDADKEADVDLNGLVATEYVTFVAPPAIAKVRHV